MSTNRNAQILYLQSECLLKYTQRKNKSLKECSLIFHKYHIFEYISDCYGFLRFYDINYIVEYIDEKIENDIVYSKESLCLFNGVNKEYCMHNLVSMVVEKLHARYPQNSEIDLISEFSQSRTYVLLFDSETGLWKEGPDYILSLYTKEKCKNKVK